MPFPFLESTLRAVFHASWQSAVLAMVVLLAAWLVPRMPAAAKSGLWLIVLARLLFPLTPQSSWSLFNLTRFAAGPSAVAVVEPQIGTDRIVSLPQPKPSGVWSPAAPRPLPSAHSEPQNPKIIPADEPAADAQPVVVGRAPSLVGITSLVWALGVAIVMAGSVRSWLRLRRFLRTCRLCRDEHPLAILDRCRREAGLRRRVELLLSDGDVAPALAGIVFPRIIVSAKTLAAIGPAELEWLVRHELAHIRRWDLAVSRLWWCARALHWFNPLVWWAASRARVDTELACDERVIGRAAVSDRAAYGQTLLAVAERPGGGRHLAGRAGPVAPHSGNYWLSACVPRSEARRRAFLNWRSRDGADRRGAKRAFPCRGARKIARAAENVFGSTIGIGPGYRPPDIRFADRRGGTAAIGGCPRRLAERSRPTQVVRPLSDV